MAVAETIDLRKYCLETAERARAASCRVGPTRRRHRKTPGCCERPSCCAASRACWPRPIARIWPRRRQFGLTEAQIDRLAAHAGVIESMAVGPGRSRGAARADRRSDRVVDSPQRPGSAQGARAAGRRVFHLRIAAQRDGRRRGDLRQERQRRDPARRQRGGALESGDRRPCWSRPPKKSDCPRDAVQLVDTTDREAVGHFLAARTNTSTWRFRAAAKA